MKRLISALCVFFILCVSFTSVSAKDFSKEQKKLIKKYQNFLGKDTELEGISWNFILEKNPDSTFVVKVINPDKLIKTSEVHYLGNLRHGAFTEWYDNGNIWRKGAYHYGKKVGLWRYYDDNGKIIRAGTFLNNKKVGVWIHQTDNMKEVTNYKRGKKEGVFERYDKEGELVCKEIYKNDSLVNTVLKDSVLASREMPVFKRQGDKELMKFLGRKANYPSDAIRKLIEGQVFIKFVVEKDGKIGEIIVLRGVCNSLEKEAVKVVKKIQKFKPGKQEGKPVRVWYHVPLSFKIEEKYSRLKYWKYE